MTKRVDGSEGYKVAVLTALYAGDNLDYFKESVQSLLQQTIGIENLNIYLYLDGELKNEQQKYIIENEEIFHKVVASDKPKGLSSGLNELLGVLDGEKYVFRIDADDICSKDRFQIQSSFMDKNPSIDLLGCNSWEMDCNGKILCERDYPESHQEIHNSVSKLNPVLHVAYCIRSRKLLADGVRYPAAELNEDLALIYELIRRGWRLHNLQERLVYVRTSNEFFNRRGLRRSFIEFGTYVKGIYSLYGLYSFNYLYPATRLVMRFMPNSIVKSLYRSKVRNVLGGIS